VWEAPKRERKKAGHTQHTQHVKCWPRRTGVAS